MTENKENCTYCNKPHAQGEKVPFVAGSEDTYCCERCYEEHKEQADSEAKKSTECEFC